MHIAKAAVPDDVRAILAECTITGNVLKLPGQLDRPTYDRVNKALTAARGKWDRKAGGHVFPFDPRELIGEAVEAGSVVDVKKSLGFFETPDDLAGEMVRLALIEPGHRVLEPSAGMGRIVRYLLNAGAVVDVVEIDPTNCAALRKLADLDLTVCQEDFVTYAAIEAMRFDAVVMNPPFANGQDVDHIRLAWSMLKPGGRLVAICCEGPFFRDDRKSAEFRDWLDEIGAVTRRLPPGTFRESSTDVATRLILAHKPGQAEDDAPATEQEPAGAIVDLPMAQVEPDPDQPRKTFERGALSELAASIRANGLLQPITVRQVAPDRYRIVAGERRWRAHQFNHAKTIRAIVRVITDESDVRVKQIIENDQRADVSPLEQARSYQALMDSAGWTVDQLAAKIGKSPHRITERTILLRLPSEYQTLLAGGNIKPSEAYELARLSTDRARTTLFNLIRAGSCRSYNDLRAAANALVQAEQQTSLATDTSPPPTKEERDDARAFERQISKVADLLRNGIAENQIIAVKKVDPHRAATMADLIAVMQKDLRRIEVALREAAVQQSFLTAA